MYTSPKILASLDATVVLSKAIGQPCPSGTECPDK